MKRPASTFYRACSANIKGVSPTSRSWWTASFGSRVVEAVVDNQADFGIVQLPVKEKRLQVAKIHADEMSVIVPAKHPLAGKTADLPQDLREIPLLLPKTGTTRSRISAWLDPVEERSANFDGARFHRDDQAFRAGRAGRRLQRGRALPRGSARGSAGRDVSGPRSHVAPDWTNL